MALTVLFVPTSLDTAVFWAMGQVCSRKVDVRLPGKGNSKSHGARPAHMIIMTIKWTRTSRLSTRTSLSVARCGFCINTQQVHGTVRIRSARTPFQPVTRCTARRTDFCITQVKAQGPSRTCIWIDSNKEEDEV